MDSNATQNGHLEQWNLPFSNKLCPSVTTIIPSDCFDEIILVVMPNGLGKYPGYILTFEFAPVLMVIDETCAPAPVPEWFDLLRSIPRSSSVIWRDSPLVKQNEGTGFNQKEILLEKLKLTHYLILGGDSIVNVLSYKQPLISEFNGPKKITMEHCF